MSDLADRLERLGLSQYLDAFVAEGFDTWETVLDITESDLNSLNVKLGHRRKLQRAIAETHGQAADRPLPIALGKTANAEGSYRSDESAPESKAKQGDITTASAGGTATKRKYRRHPKPDEHAPERPPSAYVIFSNQVRETLKGQELSFTEIAKVVGERWQVLPAESRESCERQASTAKDKYYAELAEYKKTPQYEQYQKYLEEFKAKHAAPQRGAEGKRSKLDTEQSNSTRSSSHEQPERPLDRRVSLAQSEPFATGHRAESSPPSTARLPPTNHYPSKSTSPTTYSLSGLNSPRIAENYSPISTSSRSANLHKEGLSFELQPFASEHHARESDHTHQYPSSVSGHQYPPSITPSTQTYYANPTDLPSRRPFRDPSRLPPLTHDDTTLSTESGSTTVNASTYTGSLLPVVDAPKNLRMLPQPVPSIGPGPSPLDRPPISSAQPPPDLRITSSLAALLRAGELARNANEDAAMETQTSP